MNKVRYTQHRPEKWRGKSDADLNSGADLKSGAVGVQGVEKSVDVWQSLLSVRTLVVPVQDNVDVWLKFAALCRKDDRPDLAYRTLVQLLGFDPIHCTAGVFGYGAGSNVPQVR